VQTFHPLPVAITLLCAASAQSGQYRWDEDFSHNNAALYTNLNGGPSNLTIQDGLARFGSPGGAYYGRPEFTAFSATPPIGPHLTSLEAQIRGRGSVGIGWYSPLHQLGISLLIDPQGTPTMSVLQHNGLGSTTVLESVSIAFGLNDAYITLIHDEEGSNLWAAQWVPFGGTSKTILIPNAPQLLFAEESHFLMYGSNPSGTSPGTIDWVYAAVPEPESFVLLLFGAAYVLQRRYRRKSA
jgi:hypothetical protein